VLFSRMVWSTTVNSSADKVSKSTSSRRRLLNAWMVWRRRSGGG
jgi:hypothetical protein